MKQHPRTSENITRSQVGAVGFYTQRYEKIVADQMISGGNERVVRIPGKLQRKAQREHGVNTLVRAEQATDVIR